MKSGHSASYYVKQLLVFAWISLVSFYFFGNWHPLSLIKNQTPIIPQDIMASAISIISGGLPGVMSLIVVAAAAYGLGSLLFSGFRPRIESGTAVFSLGLGIAAFSLLTFAIGLAGGYTSTGYIILFVILCVSCGYGMIRAIRYLMSMTRGGKDPYRLAFGILLSVVSLFLIAKAMKPAFFFDAVTCHLAIPNYYIHEGKIGYMPFDSYTNYPLMAEMFYTLGLFVFGLKTAQLLSVFVFIALTITVYDFSRAFIKELNPAIPAAFFLLTPAFMENAVLYTNDLYLTYFFLLALYALFLWEKERASTVLVLMGVFIGVCLGTKYLALLYAWIPFAIVIYIMARGRKMETASGPKALWLSVFAVIVVFSPWLAKNVVFTGNPVYPALYGVFGGKDMSPEVYKRILETAHHPGVRDVLTGFYRHPWEMIIPKPGAINRVYGASAFLGPLLLIFIPLMLIAGNLPAAVKRLGTVFLMLFVIWDASFNHTRYIYPGIAVATVLAAYAMYKLTNETNRYMKAALVVITVFYLFFNLNLGFYQVDTWTSAFGFEHMNETGEEFLSRKMRARGGGYLSSVEAYAYANKNIAKDARVLIVGDYQHLYIDRKYIYCALSDGTPYGVFVEKAGKNDEISRHLKGYGITHIIYNPSEMRRLQASGLINFKEEDDRYIESYLSSGNVKLVMSSKTPTGTVYLVEIL